MNTRDDDDRDDGRLPRRRSNRDMLDVGRSAEPERQRGGLGRRPDHPRDLDDEDRDRRFGDRDREPSRGDADERRFASRTPEGRERWDEARRGRGRSSGNDRAEDERRDDAFEDRRAPREDRDRSDVRDDRPAQDGGKPAQDGKDGGKPAQDGNRPARDGKDGSKPAQDGGKPAQDGDEAQARRKGRRPLVITIAVVVALLLVAGGVYLWLSGRGKASTDDAYTDGNIVAIAPQVAGQVVSLDVTDNQFVHKGDALIHIDPRQYVYTQEQSKGALDSNKAQVANQKLGVEIAKKNFPASLQLAQANLTSAKANLQLQQANNERQKNLPRQATTQQEVDTTSSGYQQALAQVEQAQARVVQAEPVQQNIGQSEQQVGDLAGQTEQIQGRLDQADLNIEWTVVRAPQDGWVTRRNVNAGNYVSSGTQIMSLVTTDMWVTANFKETELNGMRPGQTVTVAVDAYPDLALRGHVDSIQHGSGSRFSAFPAENATGNFVKIVQRVPVKIVIDSGLNLQEPLPLGVSVVPTVMLK